MDKCKPHTETKELQIFLGIYNYYAKLVPQYTHIAKSLCNLL